MNIFKELEKDIRNTCANIDESIFAKASLEIPKDTLNGDISTNIAMILASKTNSNPREVAQTIKQDLSKISYISHIEVAGPGFINISIKLDKWHSFIPVILSNDKNFWRSNIGNGEKVNIEYVSANPTGPMHIGHARGAVYGDVLANALKECNYVVTKEYYINDAGSQIDILLDSVDFRYKEIIEGKSLNIGENLYPGEYLKQVAKKLVTNYKGEFSKWSRREFKQFVVNEMLSLIKSDLLILGIQHDVFTSEQSFHDSNLIEDVTSKLQEKKFIYNGTLPPPKGKLSDDWEERKQMLFKSTIYGDNQDRPVKKSDQSWSYLASECAYTYDKIDRKFDQLIYVLGVDHKGYVKRIEALVNIFSNGKVKSNVRTTELVNFIKDNKSIKMSKRDGSFTTVSDVLDKIDKNIIRFMMLTRRNDMVLDFDLDKVKKQSKDNPVFYVQYAHVRSLSTISNIKNKMPKAYEKFTSNAFDLSLLSNEIEIELIKGLASWPRMLESVVKFCEPHRIAYYLVNIASNFHSIWHSGRGKDIYRFTVDGDQELTAARLTLVASVQKIINRGLKLMGVEPMENM